MKDIAPVNRASSRSEVSVNRKKGLNGCHIRRLSDPRRRFRTEHETNGCGNQEARDHDHPEMNRTVNITPRSGPQSRISGPREHTAVPFAKRTSVIPHAQEVLTRYRSRKCLLSADDGAKQASGAVLVTYVS